MWDLRTIDTVGRLFVTGMCGIHTPTAETRHLMVERLFDDLSMVGVQAHYLDLRFDETMHHSTGELAIVVRWAPTTKDVELLGGGEDGAVVTVAKVGEPFLFPQRVEVGFKAEPDLRPDHLRVDEYQLYGWNPRARRWAYKAR